MCSIVAGDLACTLETDDGHDRAATDAVARLTALRERFFLKAPRVPALDRVGQPEHRALADRIRAQGVA